MRPFAPREQSRRRLRSCSAFLSRKSPTHLQHHHHCSSCCSSHLMSRWKGEDSAGMIQQGHVVGVVAQRQLLVLAVAATAPRLSLRHWHSSVVVDESSCAEGLDCCSSDSTVLIWAARPLVATVRMPGRRYCRMSDRPVVSAARRRRCRCRGRMPAKTTATLPVVRGPWSSITLSMPM